MNRWLVCLRVREADESQSGRRGGVALDPGKAIA